MKKEDFLPIGSVVLLKGGRKKIMVIGYLAIDGNNLYDYQACAFPEGLYSSNNLLVFNKSQIKEVCYLGYVNEESTKFNKKIKEFLNGLNKRIDKINFAQENKEN